MLYSLKFLCCIAVSFLPALGFCFLFSFLFPWEDCLFCFKNANASFFCYVESLVFDDSSQEDALLLTQSPTYPTKISSTI
jgi:hypothetical protein